MQHDGQLPAGIDLDRLVDQIVALVDGFGLQGVLDPQDPQPEQLASRLNGAVDALIRAAERARLTCPSGTGFEDQVERGFCGPAESGEPGRGDRTVAAQITAEALAAARALGAAPLKADLEVLSRRGKAGGRVGPGQTPAWPDRTRGRSARPPGRGAHQPPDRDVLFISEKTVSVQVTNMLRKLGVQNRTEAAYMRRRLG